jgi:hypothetical protein
VEEDDDDDEKTNFTEDEVDRGVILGVYLPCSLSPPSTAVRGDPDAFIFRLTDGLISPTTGMPLGTKGVKFPSQMSSPMSSSKNRNQPPPGSETAAINQYAVCASSYMSFGASSKHSTNALRIDEEMRWVASGPADTYNSPPLLSLNECDQNGFLSPIAEQRRGSLTNYIQQVARRPNSRSRSNSNTPGDNKEPSGGGPPSPIPSHNSHGHGSLTVSVPGLSASGSFNNSNSTNMSSVSSPINPLSNSSNSMFDLDRKAGIKQIEVWCARNSYNTIASVKKKMQNSSK